MAISNFYVLVNWWLICKNFYILPQSAYLSVTVMFSGGVRVDLFNFF